MKKATRIALITALALIVLGAVLSLIGYAFGKDTFKKQFAAEERSVALKDDFSSIEFDCVSSDIRVEYASDGEARVVVKESEKLKFTVESKDGKLIVTQHDESKWHDKLFSINFASTSATVYLPKKEYASLKAETMSGDMRIGSDLFFESADMSTMSGDFVVKDMNTGSAKLETTSGNIKIDNMKAGSLNIDVTSGDITLNSVVAESLLDIRTTSGDIRFDGCDGGEIRASTVSGDITGSLLSCKLFGASTVSGRIDIPQSEEGGRCTLDTTNGDIKIVVLK